MAAANGKGCWDGCDGSGRALAAPPRPPEFNACFSSSAPAASATTAVSSVPARPYTRWGLWSPQDKSWMQLVQQNYEKHHRRPLPAAPPDNRSPLVPFIIHHIWLGSPLPEELARLRESWLSRHAHTSSKHAGPSQDGGGNFCGEGAGEWEVRLWTDADVEAFGLENKEAYDAAGNFGQKSDILRYEILLRHGGLYVDVDFLCLASFEGLHRSYDFYTGLSNTGTFELNNGLVGCRPGHPIMRDIINRIRDTCSPHRHPLPSRSSAETPAGEGNEAHSSSRSGGRPVVVGDPLSALVGALGEGGGAAGAAAGARGGLLADLLGGEDCARLKRAVTVEPGSATETIVKTGPGVFTRAVMAWMTTSAAGAGYFGTDGRRDECGLGSNGTTGPVRQGSGCSNGNGDEGGDSPSAGFAAAAAGGAPNCTFAPSSPSYRESRGGVGTTASTTAPPPAGPPPVMMVLPPSYLYPIPNNAVGATEGSLIGDGMESGVHERAGEFFAAESLAAHLWGRSWQDGNRKPAS